ncbi:hypothetical protein Lche_2972 [Legionella cherrii]|uniref:Uncharacterized protein n=1 Tax=Legionella cherrii TaxID=28084 RepID=A0A0W0SBZ0_9GAMM|nr:hypothetical protein Lche_2972 [Legionella cherrii]
MVSLKSYPFFTESIITTRFIFFSVFIEKKQKSLNCLYLFCPVNKSDSLGFILFIQEKNEIVFKLQP